MEELRTEMGIEPGYEPESIHGCSVMRNDEVTEPWLVDHDGKMYAILPKWQRAKEASQAESEDGSGETD